MATKKTTAKKKTAKKKSKPESKPKASLVAKKTATKAAKKKKSAARTKKAVKKVKLTPEQLFVETQQLAYFLAEKDGFSRNPTHYWLDAETALSKKK